MHVRVTLAGRKDVEQGFEADLAFASTQTMRDLSDWMKDAVDAQARAAGLGSRLGKATRRDVYPQGRNSFDAALFFQAKKGTNAATLFDVFDNGATIRSKSGFWLAIPTAAAAPGRYRDRNGKLGRVTPGSWERAHGIKLRFIFRRGKPGLLVADNARINSRGYASANQGSSRANGPYTRLQGRTTVVMFILVPHVTIKRRLDWRALGTRAQGMLPELMTVNLYKRK